MSKSYIHFNEILFAVSRFLELTKSAYNRALKV